MEWLTIWFLVVVNNVNSGNAVSYNIPVPSKEDCLKAANLRKDNSVNSTQKNKYLCEAGKVPVYKADSRDVLHWQKTWFLAVVENKGKPNAVAYTIPLMSKDQCLSNGQKRKKLHSENMYICENGLLPYYAP